MVKHLSSPVTVEFEFENGRKAIYGYNESLRGIRGSNGGRPQYATYTCHVSQRELDYYMQREPLIDPARFFFMDVMHVLSGGGTRGRTMIKPLWFHRMITGHE